MPAAPPTIEICAMLMSDAISMLLFSLITHTKFQVPLTKRGLVVCELSQTHYKLRVHDRHSPRPLPALVCLGTPPTYPYGPWPSIPPALAHHGPAFFFLPAAVPLPPTDRVTFFLPVPLPPTRRATFFLSVPLPRTGPGFPRLRG